MKSYKYLIISLFLTLVGFGLTSCVEDEVYVTPPAVSNITISPSAPSASDNVTVSAIVTDVVGIESVNLYYTISGQNSNTVVMNGVSGATNTYAAEIPKQAENVKVEYYVEATNKGGKTTKSKASSYTVGAIPIDFTKLKFNEIEGDKVKYIELYNMGEIELNIEGLTIIKDGKDSAPFYTAPAGVKIASKGFLVLLANADLTGGVSAKNAVTYELRDPSGNQIDYFKNPDNGGAGKYAHPSGSCFGRTTDGSGDWYILTPNTQGTSNNSATKGTKIEW